MGFVNQAGWKVGLEVIPEGDNLKLRELCHLHQLVVFVSGQVSPSLLLLAGDDDGDSGDFLTAHLGGQSTLFGKTNLTLLEVHRVGFHVGQSLILNNSDW